MRAERGLAACAIFLLALSACSQNDGGPGEGVLPSPSPSSAPPVSPTPLPGIKQGQIHDSAITGLNYRSASLAGTTNLFGQFDYRDGERVAFLIGDIAIGETAGAPLVTVTSLVTGSLGNRTLSARVINLARLLQTLDHDADPRNGIVLAPQSLAAAAGQSINFDVAPELFAQDPGLVAFLQASAQRGGPALEDLVSATAASSHLNQELDVIEQRGSPNLLPRVVVTVPESATSGTRVELSGVGEDDDGSIVSYAWEQRGGPAVSIDGADRATASFAAPAVNESVDISLRFSVVDNDNGLAYRNVMLRIDPVGGPDNTAPVIEAASITLDEDSTAQGQLIAADAEGDPVTFARVSDPLHGQLNLNANGAFSYTPLPNYFGEDAFVVRASDGRLASADVTIDVMVNPVNDPPVADAGPDQGVLAQAVVSLDGSRSQDIDDGVASHAWTQLAGPEVTLENADQPVAGFTAPDVSETTELAFSLRVTDRSGAESLATTRVIVTPVGQPQPPVANAGDDQTVDEGQSVTLDGRASQDADGPIAGYAWTQTRGPTVELQDADTPQARFVAPDVSADTELQFELEVTDGDGNTDSDQVSVRVRVLLIAPQAEAGDDQTVLETASVTLDASDSVDPDGTIASYQWEQLSGPAVVLDSTDSVTAQFVAPEVEPSGATLRFLLTVTDNDGLSSTDPVTVFVRNLELNVFRVGAAKAVVSPTQAHIDGVVETRVGESPHLQKFNLGGFGIDPTQNFPDPIGGFGDQLTTPAEVTAHVNDKGQREETWLRVLALSLAGDDRVDQTVLFVSLDAVGAGNLIQKGLKAAIVAATGVAPDNILFGQTHTHAGADLQGLWGGVPQDWVESVLYAHAAGAAKQAMSTREPVRLSVSHALDSRYNNYRRPRQDTDADADPRVTLLQATSLDGERVVGHLLQYAAHPTSINENPRAPHADYILGAMEYLEDQGGTALYFNGPIADASGAGSREGCVSTDADYGNVRCRGEGIAEAGVNSRGSSKAALTLTPALSVRHEEVVLPITNPLFVGAGLLGAFNRYYDFAEVPTREVPLVGEMLADAALNLPQVTPTATTLVSRITLGGENGLDILTMPGEATNTLGSYLRSLSPASEMMLFGLTQNSFGYLLPEEEFNYIDTAGDDGFTLPFTGYEEFVSLGPMTVPLLKLEGYHPLYDLSADANMPAYLAACNPDPTAEACILNIQARRLDYTQRGLASQCRDNGGPEDFCGLLDPDTPLREVCDGLGLPADSCAAFGSAGGDDAGNSPADLLAQGLQATLRGCDPLDAAHCLYPFPSNQFVVDATSGVQSRARGGTGKRVSFNPLAMPRNSAGKPIDASEWNRNDGFSPGQLIITYVEGLDLEQTYGLPAEQLGVTNPALSMAADAPVFVLELDDDGSAVGRHPVFVEMDANANLLVRDDGHQRYEKPGYEGRSALLIRPARNFKEGARYVVVLRNLKNAAGVVIPAGAVFDACRKGVTTSIPGVDDRCAELAAEVFPALDGAADLDEVYLSWDFTVASTMNNIGRLRHMRDVAGLGDECGDADGCAAPAFTVDEVLQAGQGDIEGGMKRQIRGTLTVPSFVVPTDARPLDDPGVQAVISTIQGMFPDGAEALFEGAGIAQGASAPPNRLYFSPYDEADPFAPLDPANPDGARYGDGLPDVTGTMNVPFICTIPEQATSRNRARAGIYGHGLLDQRGAIRYDGVDDMSREYNYLFCAVDLFGFSQGDIPNVASTLVDLSSFAVVPDASQQGLLNYVALARALRSEQGFLTDPAFQDDDGKPLYDPREIFYDGNSQGGIVGGAFLAVSKDVKRGVLGSLGMNYSMLLRRSVDFDLYSIPLYLSYTDELDRNVLFSLMQMLWDRSENNGYAHHIVDNSAFGGPANVAKLDPQFGDHQVTPWSADVMARTMGIPWDGSINERARIELGQEKRHPDVTPGWGLETLDYSNPGQTQGSALVLFDMNRGGFAEIPPVSNVPPQDGVDPHDNDAKDPRGRCHKAHFLRTNGELIDTRDVLFDGASCPAVPAVDPFPAEPDRDNDGVPDDRDAFPDDPNESADADGDGVGDNADLCPGTAAGETANEQGCASSQIEHASCTDGQGLDGGRSYQVTLTSASDQRISFQVLEPTRFDCAGAAIGAHPLVLHGHGFGGSRSTGGFASLRNAGMTVISIDQRGFGDSSGTVRVMDPDFEGLDLVQILDWAETHLDYLAWRDDSTGDYVARPATATSVAGGDNLLVGAIGGSYGGGYQFLLSFVDPKQRLDVLAPEITWHDLRYSLNPGDAVKAGWDLLLSVGGEAGSYQPGFNNGDAPQDRGMDPYIVETLARGAATNEFPREALEWFRYHSPSYWCGLNGQPTMPYAPADWGVADPNVSISGLSEQPGSNTRTGQKVPDVLLIQGMRDTLFNFNDAWWNYQCLSNWAGDAADVRLLTTQSGHNLANTLPDNPVYTFQNPNGPNRCGELDAGSMVTHWLKAKLRGDIASQAVLENLGDELCISLTDASPSNTVADRIRIPGDRLPGPTANGPQGFTLEPATGSVEQVSNGLLAQSAYLAGETAPAVIPLADAVTDGILAGIPMATITLSTPAGVNDAACELGTVPTARSGCDAMVYIGLGLSRDNGANWSLIDDQLTPVRGIGTHYRVDLVGLGERFASGDQVGLLVYGFHPQFFASYSRDPLVPVVNVDASVWIPLVEGELTVAASAPPTVVTEKSCNLPLDDPSSVLTLRGSLHEHSGYSDGSIGTTPADYYAAGSQRGLDFMGGSDHSDNALIPVTASTDCASAELFDCFQASPEGLQKWSSTQQFADAASTEGFTAFRGFEWTSDRFGHINVFFSTNDLNAKTSTGYALDMTDFWLWFGLDPATGGGADGLAVFNHPGREDTFHAACDNFDEFDENDPFDSGVGAGLNAACSTVWPGDASYNWNDFAYDADFDERVVGIEVYGKGSDVYDNDNNAPPGGWYAYALDKGWHLGPVGAEDEHGQNWAQPIRAKTIFLSAGRSRLDLKNAMRARRFYALAHGYSDVRISFTAQGQPMGSAINAPAGTVPFAASVDATGSLLTDYRIELVGPGGIVMASRDNGPLQSSAEANAAERWHYMRVIDRSTGKPVAYSAPIWFRAADTDYEVCAADVHPPAEPVDGGSDSETGLPISAADFEAAVARLQEGDLVGASNAVLAGLQQNTASALQAVMVAAGEAAGLDLPAPGPKPAASTQPVQDLRAGVAKAAIHVPVGTPLGGYLRPPIAGEYIPGAEAFAAGNPGVFFDELVDFIPVMADGCDQNHPESCPPLAPLPDELRAIHSPYATYSPPSRGYYDSLIAKAVALHDGTDYVVLVKTDFIGMLNELVEDVKAAVQVQTGVDLGDGLIMSATHTHDGPGALANNSTRYFWLAMDVYQPDVYRRVVDQLAAVVTDALEGMQPAVIGHGSAADRKGLNGYRRGRLAHYDEIRRDALRERIGVLQVSSAESAEPMAVIINWAAHGIAFDVENQFFSGDVLASVERETEQLMGVPVAMLVQNASGDVSPRNNLHDNKLQRIEAYGKRLAPQVAAIAGEIVNWQAAPDLRAVTQRVILDRAHLGYEPGEYPYPWGGGQCGNDVAVPFVGYGVGDIPGYDDTGAPQKIPFCLPSTPPDAADLADNGVAENGSFYPQDAIVTAARIGDIVLLGQPGEPLVEYGVRLLDRARALGFNRADTFIWGYTGDHIGYILPPEEEDWATLGGAESTTTFWGWKQGERFLQVTEDLLFALRDGSPAPRDEFTADYSLYGDVYAGIPGPAPTVGLFAGAALVQPTSINRFGSTAFVFEGGDPVVDTPQVRMERRQGGGQWEPVRRANGEIVDTFFEMHLEYRLVSGRHLWSVIFEAPRDWPADEYRFVVAGQAISPASGEPDAYVLESDAFAVGLASLRVEALPEGVFKLAYAPRPDNYRVVDAEVRSEHAAPVRVVSRMVAEYPGGATMTKLNPPVMLEGSDPPVAKVSFPEAQGASRVRFEDAWGNFQVWPEASGGASEEPEAGRGAGLLGVIADLGAESHAALTALLDSNPESAAEHLQQAIDDVATAVEEGPSNVDPERPGETLIGFGGEPLDVAVAALSRARNAAPVVVTGSQLPGWSVPPAHGVGYPYPSGATITGALLDAFEGAVAPGAVRDAHNGVILYPNGSVPPASLVPVENIAAYRWEAGGWVEIPVQVDEKAPYFLANANSDFSVYSGTDPEITYVWDNGDAAHTTGFESWMMVAGECHREYPEGLAAVPDPVPGLDDDDEIVFMYSDAGEINGNPASMPPGATSMQMLTVVDPMLEEAGLPPRPRAVYLVQKEGGSTFPVNHYVRYQRDPDADQWIDRSFFGDSDPEKLGTSNTGYGANLQGTVCPDGTSQSARASSDRFPRDGLTVTTDTYQWRASGRWMVRSVKIRNPDAEVTDSSYWDGRPDLVDRWKGRAFQQSPDSTISLVGFEDEQVNWEGNASLLGERCGPVRCIRETWGADSGTNVTKTETFYRDAVSYQYRVRVHPIPADGLYTSWDYNRSAMVVDDSDPAGTEAGRYFTMLRPQGVPIDGVNDDLGNVDGYAPILAGQCLGSDGPTGAAGNGRCPAFFDTADPTFNLPLAFDNWEQVSGKGDAGSLVYSFELVGLTSLANPLVVPYYRDDACLDDGTGDDPVARFWPGESYDWNGGKVRQAYDAHAGRTLDYSGTVFADCLQRQGAHGSHGVHYFVTHDSDNAFTPTTSTEIDARQWQYMVPSTSPRNVGEPYANNVRVPLKVIASPMSLPGLLGGP